MSDIPSSLKTTACAIRLPGASVSIMNNVAERYDGGSNAEFIRFLGYAQRSATEVKSCLYVALDNAYISESEFEHASKLADDSRNLIGGFIKYLKQHAKV